jgi:hypothetical protein
MSNTAHLNIPLSFNQIVDLIKQLPKTQQKKLVSLIQEQDKFSLSTQQIVLLDKRSKTPLDNYISASESVKLLKKKYGV